jgi:hypothetical protein
MPFSSWIGHLPKSEMPFSSWIGHLPKLEIPGTAVLAALPYLFSPHPKTEGIRNFPNGVLSAKAAKTITW